MPSINLFYLTIFSKINLLIYLNIFCLFKFQTCMYVCVAFHLSWQSKPTPEYQSKYEKQQSREPGLVSRINTYVVFIALKYVYEYALWQMLFIYSSLKCFFLLLFPTCIHLPMGPKRTDSSTHPVIYVCMFLFFPLC